MTILTSLSLTVTVSPTEISTYNVIFTESGLDTGQSWAVTLNGVSQSSTTPTITFSNLANGSYPYTVTAISGYSASPASGTITVSDATASEQITFTSISTSGLTCSADGCTNLYVIYKGQKYSDSGVNVGWSCSEVVGTIGSAPAGTVVHLPAEISEASEQCIIGAGILYIVTSPTTGYIQMAVVANNNYTFCAWFNPNDPDTTSSC